ncbi:hypothetical protein K438DRAFT_1975696 [Mycena galopus ATCC 62051]|nr:hypothetical protein K438DRAFT_1975696 [Mycena galopus ATCC 62051]
MTPELPPEIYGAICDELEDSTGTLALLCRTSRNFCYLAQRILYRSVDLRERSIGAADSWALTVTRHSHLAERLHALALHLPEIRPPEDRIVLPAIQAPLPGIEAPQLPTIWPMDTANIGYALSRCVNLKELRLSGDSRRHRGWMMQDHPFRLQKFESLQTLTIPQKFWGTQTQIRVLSLHPNCFYPSFKSQLLNVIAFGTSLHRLPARPLQRVETGFQLPHEFSPLAQYSQTLTTVSIRGMRLVSILRTTSIGQILAGIADSVPALLHLSIVEQSNPGYVDARPFSEVTPTPILRERFRKLETFVLQMRSVSRFLSEEPGSSFSYDMALADDVEAFGVAIMTACRTLLRVVIGAEVVLDERIVRVLRRTSRGEIHAEAGTTLEAFEALSVFWDPEGAGI